MSLANLIKQNKDTDTASVDAERQRVAGLVGLKDGLPFKFHEQVDKMILDGKTVEEAKAALFDSMRTVPAAPDKDPEPGPLATAKAPDVHAPKPGTFGEAAVRSYMKQHDCTLEEAIAALAPTKKGGTHE